MIIVKVLNQKIIQVALSSSSHHHQSCSGQIFSSLKATRYPRRQWARTLVQSTHQNQQVTNSNNQQLIPIARNISFRQCLRAEQQSNKSNAQLFSISAAGSHASQFISTHLEADDLLEDEDQMESPIETLKRKAKDIVEKREVAAKSKYYGQSFNETLSTASDRKLVVLISWLEAQEKHIEKYRQFYLERGFDVLNVKTSSLDLLLPKIGAKKISKDFVRFMVEKEYSNVVIHGFSVGGYMFGQVLLDIDQQEEQVKEKLLNSIRGLVFDSIVTFEGTCIGVANSITQNPLLAKVIENLLRLYLKVGHSFATKYYLQSSDKFWSGPVKCPSLFLASKDDRITDHKLVEKLVTVWNGLGLDARKRLFDSSPHVQLFIKHQSAYVEEVEKFLKELKMY